LASDEIEEAMHAYQELIDEAKANRSAFLKPYREKFEGAITRNAKANIIVELIEIEPSHLSEEWIVNEAISWLRDCHNCKDYIDAVFIKAPKRHTPTETQRINYARAYYLRRDIDQIKNKNKISTRKACAKLMTELVLSGKSDYLGWNLTDGSVDVEKSFRQLYQRTKDYEKKLFPPFPYYGRDIIETDGIPKI
jgi:hypothetical protein